MPDFAISDNAAVQRQFDRLNALSPGRDILGLERISLLLERLGNPHRKLPSIFHVAGTNGKGSTCAFLRAAIEASGMTCHVYTSPHLVRFNERIRLNGRLIEDDILAAYLKRVLDIAENSGASFFEVTTAAAFLAFAETPADACILEVGLGGRLDATNVVPSPVACGIAALGIDHEAFLLTQEDGTPTTPLERIAFEKAGIAKSGAPLVIQRYSTEMMGAIARQAMAAGATVIVRGEDWDSAVYDGHLHYRDAVGKLTLTAPRLAGAHQADNAALAIAMLRHQDAIPVNEAEMSAALGWAEWPARLQRLAEGPLTAALPEDVPVWLDGGHNVDAGNAIAKHFKDDQRAIHLVIGMLSNKDPSAIIAPLKNRLASITVLPVPGHEYHDIDTFHSVYSGGANISHADSIQQAMAILAQTDLRNTQILIAGSLYLAGDVLKANDQLPT